MSSSIGYPDHASTMRILEGADQRAHDHRIAAASSTPRTIVEMAALARTVLRRPDASTTTCRRLVDATRTAPRGAPRRERARRARPHPRGEDPRRRRSGRHYVVPDDVKALAEPVLAHRLILDPEAEFDGVTTSNIIAQVLIETPPP